MTDWTTFDRVLLVIGCASLAGALAMLASVVW
jgi:hypothetical protein